MQDVAFEPDVLQTVADLDLDSLPLWKRVRLLTGATNWILHPLEEAELRSIAVSDGPIGVRGIDDGLGESAQLPNPSAVAATWDLELVGRLGLLVASEAKRKGADVVLAPVVNLQRTPFGGRHFECYSEDPLLTGKIAAAYITSVQTAGIGACVKHFLGNESETERTTYVARIDERTLREMYFAPFERAVKEAGVWSVMAAYNGVDDGVQRAAATEHGNLLNTVLKNEWGFDGVVVSDWLAANSTAASALAGLDLVMPGPGGPWEQHLLDAVQSGAVPVAEINNKVRRILTLGARVGALGNSGSTVASLPADSLPTTIADTRSLLREAVARSIVVLRNENSLLPLHPTDAKSVAMIGPAAVQPFVQGGGSAFVTAPYLSTPEQALRDALPEAKISVHQGGTSRRHAPAIEPRLVLTPSGNPGYELTLLDDSGDPVGETRAVNAEDGWNRQPAGYAATAKARAVVHLKTPGVHRLEVGVSGAHRVWFNEELVSHSAVHASEDVILDSSANNPFGPSRRFTVQPGTELVIRIEAELQAVDAAAYGGFVRFQLRHEPVDTDIEEEISAAVAAAAAADVAIVIVGTNEETESEGWDRQTLALPGRQDELVRRVLAVNPCTIVVVNSGAPVLLPWLDDVPAVLWWWLPGQEAGNGLADALLGLTEPSGRLPWTLPAREEDLPVAHAVPVVGLVDYVEKGDIGYRGWDRLGRTPARPFGFGLGYTTVDYTALLVDLDLTHGEVHATVTVANLGTKGSRDVIQIYVEAPGTDPMRPVRWLAGFETVTVPAGETVKVVIDVEARAFQIWDISKKCWSTPPGEYRILAGRSSRDIRQTATILL